MTDYLIIGGNLAGIAFAETALQNNKSFIVVSDESQNSSLVAAGIYNPVILKRFSLPQDAHEHLAYMKPFYKNIAGRLGVHFDIEIPIYRRFASVEEQNLWFEAADKPKLTPFLDTNIKHEKFTGIDAAFGYGRVKETGYIDTNILITSYRAYLKQSNLLRHETFQYNLLEVFNDHITYKDITAKHIIFAEGFGIHQNPYFKKLPLDGTKGELLIIHAPDLQLPVGVNAGVFILPIGNDLYKVGATYEWDDKTATPTAAGKAELTEKLDEIITCPYEVVNHLAGIRPTVKDRKALVGTHPQYKNMHLLNGLGTRGVMLGPYMAKELFESIATGVPVKREINLNRFKVF
ncbi:NAD(P)/FAD-dependent oxidoreductase [Flavobacterium sp. RHBU_24]|uniref:NAD(P)/FAD-dependent oxidoreductase n=1 Tax=Flavobacterium sp. RHBU_24 TaxID=3391185 RepID=UPI003984CE00